jgi:hypothetical protein
MVGYANPILDPTAGNPPHSRRWIPLSLRMYMVFVMVVGLIGGWWIVFRAYPQWSAIREIEWRGGLVMMGATGPAILRRCVGSEWMKAIDTAIDFVSLANTQFTDTDIPLVEALSSMTGLSLRDTQITDASLARLTSCPRLEVLELDGTLITDAGLQHLPKLLRLRFVSLAGTKISDIGLERMMSMRPTLQELNLDGTNITDAGLQHLRGQVQLRKLSVRETDVTEDGIDALKRVLPGLTIIK